MRSSAPLALILIIATACTSKSQNEHRGPSSEIADAPYMAIRSIKDEEGKVIFQRSNWFRINGKQWRKRGDPSGINSTEEVDDREGNRGNCKPGMVEVHGKMRLDPKPITPTHWDRSQTIDELQKASCSMWISKQFPERCKAYDAQSWQKAVQTMATKEMRFCIDRYEYPNIEGEYPMVMVNLEEAKLACSSQGKRLCDEDEWTFACEGEETLPYPYGYERSEEKCNIDRTWRAFDSKLLRSSNGQHLVNELYRLWQGVKSGEYRDCRSPFGVYDMTGNVDEWTTSVRKDSTGKLWGKYEGILKGGYWGPSRGRCRPANRSFHPTFYFYEQGLRCCTDLTK